MKKQLLVIVMLLGFVQVFAQDRGQMSQINTPYSWVGGEFRKRLYVANDTVALSYGAIAFLQSTNSWWKRNNTLWIEERPTASRFGNGLTFRNDSALFGGELFGFTHLIARSQRRTIPQVGTASLILSNVGPDSSGYPIYGAVPGSNFAQSPLILSRKYYANDTLRNQYGGNAASNTVYDFTGSTTFRQRQNSMAPSYGGFYGTTFLYPPTPTSSTDTSFATANIFGGVPAPIAADLSFGNGAYRLVISGTNQIPHYKYSTVRFGVDFARNTQAAKHEIRGNGVANIVLDFRDHQAAIDAGTTEYGSYVGSLTGIHMVGDIWEHPESPSKVKSLAVSMVDTTLAMVIEPLWRPLNTTRTGVGIWQKGTSDFNLFAGKVAIGGALPTTQNGGQTADFKVTGTAAITSTATGVITDSVLVKRASDGLVGVVAQPSLNVGFERTITNDPNLTKNDTTLTNGFTHTYAASNGTNTRIFAGAADIRSFNTVSGFPAILFSDAVGIKGRVGYSVQQRATVLLADSGQIHFRTGPGSPTRMRMTYSGSVLLGNSTTDTLNMFTVLGTVKITDTVKLTNIANKVLDTTALKLVVVDASGNIFKSPWQAASGGAGSVPYTRVPYGNSSNVSTTSTGLTYVDTSARLTAGDIRALSHFEIGMPHALYAALSRTSIFFGNSLFAGTTINPSYMRASTQIANITNVFEQNRAISGTRLVAVTGADSSMQNRQFIIPTYDANIYDGLYFEYGTNDALGSIDTATFRSVYNTIIDGAVTKGWPLNKIIVITLGLYRDVATQARNEYFYLITKDLAIKKGVVLVDTYAAMLQNGGVQNLLSDSVHYTPRGVETQVAAAAAVLGKGGTERVNGYLHANMLNVHQVKNPGNASLITLYDTTQRPFLEIRGKEGGSATNNSFSLGFNSLAALTTGTNTIAIGAAAGRDNTTGSLNTFIGGQAGRNNTTGGSNTAIGFSTLLVNNGDDNFAGGYRALRMNTSGQRNSAVGVQALDSNTTGQNNTALGYKSLAGNTTGLNNTGFGYLSLIGNKTGSHNVSVGGYPGKGTALSNQVVIADNQANVTVYGDMSSHHVGIATENPLFTAHVGGFLGIDSTSSGTMSDSVLVINAHAVKKVAPRLRGSLVTQNTTNSVNLAPTIDHTLVKSSPGASNITITLAAAEQWQKVTIKKIDAGVGTVTVGVSVGSIDGAATVVLLTQWDTVTLWWDGGTWNTIPN